VLTDDNFASIEAAVEEGRSVFDNACRIDHYHTFDLSDYLLTPVVRSAGTVAGVVRKERPVPRGRVGNDDGAVSWIRHNRVWIGTFWDSLFLEN
jgi:hypothetical protein